MAERKKIWRAARAILQSLKNGAGIYESCEAAGVSHMSLWRWRQKSKSFNALVCRVLDARVSLVEDKMYAKALAGDNVCMIFWLKNRAGWKDSPSVIVETGTQVKTPHAIIFSAVKEDCNLTVENECQTKRI